MSRCQLPSHRRRWGRFESLEARRLLATLGVDIRFLDDNAGSPGAELSTSVLRGETFWVEVRVQDIRSDDTPEGVIALPLNLSWDPDLFQFVDADSTPAEGIDPLPLSNQWVTDQFPLQRALASFDADAAAFDPTAAPATLLDFFNLRGVRGGALPNSGQGAAIGVSTAETFSRLQFVAIANATDAPFTVNLDGSMSFADAAPLDAVTAIGNAAGVPALANTVAATLPIAGGEISGTKFDDSNGNGIRDAGEPGIRDVTIQLTPVDPAGAVVQVQTDSNGDYQFVDLPAGSYTVSEIVPTGSLITLPTDNLYEVVLAQADSVAENLDFGNQRVEAGSSLSGFVYSDVDRDGVFDDGEFGLVGWTIELFAGSDTTPLQTTTTDAAGGYTFQDLPADTYRVVQTQLPSFVDASITLGTVLPAGEVRGITNGFNRFEQITLDGQESAIDYNFGENLAAVTKRLFLSSSNARRELCSQSALSCQAILGTAADDQIVVEHLTNSRMRITVNDSAPIEFDAAAAEVVLVEGLGGQDTVSVIGNASDEDFTAAPSMVTLTAADQRVGVFGAEQILVSGGGGTDTGVLRDSDGADQLNASGDSVVLTSPDNQRIEMVDIDTILAISATDDAEDEADLEAIDFVLRLSGDWT